MKKIKSLKNINVLSRKQLKTIFGAYEDISLETTAGDKKKKCDRCSANSQCISGVCGHAEVYCGDDLRRCF